MDRESLKYEVILNAKNIMGPTISGRIVVIECDDFGGIRMPSKVAYSSMVAEGVGISPSRYNRFDTLEDKDDLEQMFELLASIRDVNGNPAVISPFVNMANPDFDKIKSTEYEEYHYEVFTETLKRYGRHGNTMKVWRQGMDANLFDPQFHGREHICVQPWLQKLRQGDRSLLRAFDFGFVAVSNIPGLQKELQEFRPELYFTDKSQTPFLNESIVDGVNIFKKVFEYVPSSFAPSNSVFHPDFDLKVRNTGVPFVVVAHCNPTPSSRGSMTFTSYTFRRKINRNRLNYYIRNCAFEPNDESYTTIEKTLQQIAAAFRWRKPAIISTHRVNFVGGIHQPNRSRGLKELRLLLLAIVKRWPDVQFMSTSNMLRKLKN